MPTSGSAKGRRPLRVAAEILRELHDIIRRHIDLPENSLISITDVIVSDDLSFAKVYFTMLGEPSEKEITAVAQLLNSHKGVVRHEIAQRMVMRQHPDIRFVYDPTPVRAARIEQLLKQVREQSDADKSESDGGDE